MDKSTRLSTLLAGTTTDTRATALLHLLFWLVTYSWFAYQSRWLSGGLHPEVTTLMALSRNAVVLATFYSISYFISPRRYVPLTWLLVVALLLLSVLGYCLLAYYLYNWIKLVYPDMPSYFNNIVGNISRQGPWTFLYNPDVMYFHGIQIVTAFFIPFAIKGLRVVFRSQVRSIALEKDNLRLELDFLRAQINPHFLFNTLNSVYSLIEDKNKTAATIVCSLSNMMRYALYESAAPKVEVGKELDFIQNYIEIQRIRHRHRLDVTIDISPALAPQYIPPLLLINFIENAIKHGIDKLLKQAWIRIRAYRDAEGAFCFSVVNAKPSRSKEKISEGIGIKNTRRRLHILYPSTHSLHIKYTENQYEIMLRIWQ
jgi:two-component system LytT family sensor kinase